MTKSVRMTEVMGLQTLPKNRYWRCRRDVQRLSVPVGAAATGKAWKTGASDDKRWCRSILCRRLLDNSLTNQLTVRQVTH